jgi:phospholipase/lecithinase/hemolysin
MICRIAAAKRATCVDLVPAFNGPTGDKNPGALVGRDNIHPTQPGHEGIATTIAAAGHAPLE